MVPAPKDEMIQLHILTLSSIISSFLECLLSIRLYLGDEISENGRNSNCHMNLANLF